MNRRAWLIALALWCGSALAGCAKKDETSTSSRLPTDRLPPASRGRITK